MVSGRVDIQHHIFPPRYVEAVGEDAIVQLIVSGRMPEWTPAVSIEAMDRNDIEIAVTSVSAPGFHYDDEDAAVAVARHCNEYAADLRRLYPGRFGFFATLPMPHVQASLEEIAYSLDVLGADGVCLLTNYENAYPGDPVFAPVLAELHWRQAVVFFHPADVAGTRPLPHVPAATLEFPFDTTRAIVSLLLSGGLRPSDGARFIFSHAGGAIPYLADRVARLQRRPEFATNIGGSVTEQFERLYFDVALSANARIFASLTQLAKPDRILFASDYPFAGEDTMAGTIAGLKNAVGDAGALHAIERGNALALVPKLLDLNMPRSHAVSAHSRGLM